jgi:hypothetical protein
MKNLITTILLVLIATTLSYSQSEKTYHIFNYQTFDTDIFNFVPIKREGVTDQKFNYALRILDDTKSITKNDPKKLTVTDFWNITSAFVTLKEPAENIEISFKKAIALDAKSVCSYIQMAGASNLEKAIPETFLPFYANCLENSSNKNDKLDVVQYATDNKLDIRLVSLINSIDLDDQKFRLVTPLDQVKQRPFDIQNERRIDSLYAVYKTYIGKTLVGKDYESVMWSVIQHSDIHTMERYLPQISKAVEQKELSAEPLKMLIDRVYTVKYHYQIFGSQLGVPVADEKTKSEVIKNYKLE